MFPWAFLFPDWAETPAAAEAEAKDEDAKAAERPEELALQPPREALAAAAREARSSAGSCVTANTKESTSTPPRAGERALCFLQVVER